MEASGRVGERRRSGGTKTSGKRWLLGTLVVMIVSLLAAGCGSTEAVVTSTEATTGPASSTTTTTQPSTTTTTQPSTTTTTDGHIAASGEFTRTSRTAEMSPGASVGMVIIRGSDDLEFHGTLEGIWKNQYVMEVNQATGKLTMTADITFTGKVDGKEGTFIATEVGSGQFSSADSGTISGRTTIVGGTGELVNLRGEINGSAAFSPEALEGTYTGELYFEG